MAPRKVPFMQGIPPKKRSAEFFWRKVNFMHGSIISGQGRVDKGRIKGDKKDKGNAWEDDNFWEY